MTYNLSIFLYYIFLIKIKTENVNTLNLIQNAPIKKESFYVDLDTYFYHLTKLVNVIEYILKKAFFKILNLNLDQN